MRILIENAESREYLANDGKWTKKADGGRDFGATQAAFEAATREAGPRAMEVHRGEGC